VETGGALCSTQPFKELKHVARYSSLTGLSGCVMSICFLPGREEQIVCAHAGGWVTVLRLSEVPRLEQIFCVGDGTLCSIYEVAAVDADSVLVLHEHDWETWALWPEPHIVKKQSALRVVEGGVMNRSPKEEDLAVAAPMLQGMEWVARPFDHAVSAPVDCAMVEVVHVKAAHANALRLQDPVFGDALWIGEQGLSCVAMNDDGELVVGNRFGAVLHLIAGRSAAQHPDSLRVALMPGACTTLSGIKPDSPVEGQGLEGGPEVFPFADPAGTVTNSVGMKLVPIPVGEFLMGTPASTPCYNEDELAALPAELADLLRSENCEPGDADEEFQHRVRITKPFLLGMRQVTQSQYEEVTGENPSFFKGPDLPVEHLTWGEARRLCELLSELPEERAAGRHYRLPTEAEWEYACRAGTTTIFNTGDWLGSNEAMFSTSNRLSPRQTVRVGSYAPNAWGLFDMHGNVWEWTNDWYSADYFQECPVDDPKGPRGGTHHTLRGGSASVKRHECRSAFRGEAYADGPDDES